MPDDLDTLYDSITPPLVLHLAIPSERHAPCGALLVKPIGETWAPPIGTLHPARVTCPDCAAKEPR